MIIYLYEQWIYTTQVETVYAQVIYYYNMRVCKSQVSKVHTAFKNLYFGSNTKLDFNAPVLTNGYWFLSLYKWRLTIEKKKK